MEAASHDGGVVSLVRGGRGEGREEKEVTPRTVLVTNFPLDENFKMFENLQLMKKKYPSGIGPAGRWLIFAGIPLAILAILLATTLHDGHIRGVGENFLPYVVAGVPAIIMISAMALYDYFPKRLVIPFGIIGWIVNFSVLNCFFWFGPGAFGHY